MNPYAIVKVNGDMTSDDIKQELEKCEHEGKIPVVEGIRDYRVLQEFKALNIQLNLRMQVIAYDTDNINRPEFSNMDNYIQQNTSEDMGSLHNNAFQFKSGERYNFGTFDNVPIEFEFHNGRLLSSISMPPELDNLSNVDHPLRKNIASLRARLSEKSVKEIFELERSMNNLISVANHNAPDYILNSAEILPALEKCGIDTSKNFVVNGTEFKVEENERLKYATPKQYVKLPDGRIFIMDKA